MPSWVGFDTEVQAAIFNEIVEIHGLQDDSPERERLISVLRDHTFWGGYIAPLFDRIMDEAEIEL